MPLVFARGETASSHSSGFFVNAPASWTSLARTGVEWPHAPAPLGTGGATRGVSCHRRGSYVRFPPPAPGEPDDGLAHVPAGDSSSFGVMGDGGCGGHVRG